MRTENSNIVPYRHMRLLDIESLKLLDFVMSVHTNQINMKAPIRGTPFNLTR